MTRAQAHRDNSLPLDDEHSGLTGQVANDSAVHRPRERHHGVAPLHHVELNFNHLIDSIAPEKTEHHHRDREGNADNGKRGAQRTSGNIAQHHRPTRVQRFR